MLKSRRRRNRRTILGPKRRRTMSKRSSPRSRPGSFERALAIGCARPGRPGRTRRAAAGCEDVVRVVRGHALAVERPRNPFERIPSRNTRGRTAARSARSRRRFRGTCTTRRSCRAPDLLDRRESAARGVELAVPASGENGPVSTSSPSSLSQRNRLEGIGFPVTSTLAPGSSCARRPPGARPGPSPRGSARRARRGTGRDPSATVLAPEVPHRLQVGTPALGLPPPPPLLPLTPLSLSSFTPPPHTGG